MQRLFRLDLLTKRQNKQILLRDLFVLLVNDSLCHVQILIHISVLLNDLIQPLPHRYQLFSALLQLFLTFKQKLLKLKSFRCSIIKLLRVLACLLVFVGRAARQIVDFRLQMAYILVELLDVLLLCRLELRRFLQLVVFECYFVFELKDKLLLLLPVLLHADHLVLHLGLIAL